MINATTRQPLHVGQVGETGPYLWLPLSQLDEVRRLLDRHAVPYRVRQYAISLDQAPADIIIDMQRKVDPLAVQKILDEAD